MPQPPRLAAFALLAPLAGVSSATAAMAAEPDFHATVAEARAAAFQARPPVAQLSEAGGFDQRRWSVNTFYVVWSRESPARAPRYVARRQIGGRGAPTTELWADSRACPALIPALTAMAELPAARPAVPGLGRELRTVGLVLDGAHHTLWNSSALTEDGKAVVGLEITGDIDTPMAKWWSETQRALSACWTPETPSA